MSLLMDIVLYSLHILLFYLYNLFQILLYHRLLILFLVLDFPINFLLPNFVMIIPLILFFLNVCGIKDNINEFTK